MIIRVLMFEALCLKCCLKHVKDICGLLMLSFDNHDVNVSNKYLLVCHSICLIPSLQFYWPSCITGLLLSFHTGHIPMVLSTQSINFTVLVRSGWRITRNSPVLVRSSSNLKNIPVPVLLQVEILQFWSCLGKDSTVQSRYGWDIKCTYFKWNIITSISIMLFLRERKENVRQASPKWLSPCHDGTWLASNLLLQSF